MVRGILIGLNLAASTTVSAAGGVAARSRVVSLAVVRGAVMVPMAIDHVRVYSGVPGGGPMAGVFLFEIDVALLFVLAAGTLA